ncbi:phosphoglycerate mutase-like protein AT74H [Heracleum sosnowskyi]|uniref:Phosphoglycerate mutase-like protein AT74H n=1 Tax=Heracleum sosnowskyi TaxID=360622 RepID=A0AAD8M0S5_9APIA|nr:phosphoglycerate mutase-like protein AT74H [Heracleum sosnowskyi]
MSALSSTFFQASSPILHQKFPTSTLSIRCSCDDTSHDLGDTNGLASVSNQYNTVLQNPNTIRPPRPRRIILVRHGQSEGNVDEGAYTRVADPNIALTEKGLNEAAKCGEMIKEMIKKDEADDWKVYFYVSPYRRARETLRNVGKAFGRSRIVGLREEPRLREQDFGNFQDREQMKIQKAARHLYGRFFYRFPNGESAADVYDRITGFRETLKSDIDVGRFQPPVKQFEGLHNMNNGSIMVMERGHGGRYSLLMHHTKEELREFGLTEEMLTDQEWQKIAKPGELNYDSLTTGPSFFTHFEEEENISSVLK